jgi:branched-chain amino acid transport system permease protein
VDGRIKSGHDGCGVATLRTRASGEERHIVTGAADASSVAAPRPARIGRSVFWLVPLALLPLPLFLNEYHQYVVNLILVYVPVGIGFNVVVGNLGLLAFSNVAFFGIGAYTAGILMLRLGIPWWVAVPPAAVMGALAGAAASVPALRGVRLFYLAIMTLAFGELMRWVYIRWEPVTGGSMGMAIPEPTLLGWTLGTDARKFYVFLALVIVTIIATDRVLRSRFGRAFLAIRGNEEAAKAMGIPTDRYITLGFAWGGAVVGIGGAMYAALIGHLTPLAFDLSELILQFAIIMVGGLGSLAGSVLGAVIITAAPEFFRDLPGFTELIFGLIIVLVLLFLPRGLASLLAKLHPIFQDRYYR